MIAGLAATLPRTLTGGLRAQGVPLNVASHVAHLPPVSTLFSALLGYNPIGNLLGPSGALARLPRHNAAVLTGTQFFPHLIPGRSLVVQQDYLYHHWVAWLHVTMELYADYFEYVCDTEVNSAVFLNTKPIPESVLRRHSVESLSVDERCVLMDRAAARFEGRKRDLLVSAKAHFLGMMTT